MGDVVYRDGAVISKAHLIQESIAIDLEDIERKFLEVGSKLLIVREFKLWKELGYADIEAFWQQVFHRERSTLYGLMAVASEFGGLVSSGAAPLLPQTRLVALLPLLRGKSDEEKVECIQRLSELGPSDFSDEIQIMRGKPSALECGHSHEVILAKCVKCGHLRKVSQT